MHSILNVVSGSDTPNYDLTTTENVVVALGLDGESDELIEIDAQITFQSQVVASLLGRVLASQDVVETFWTDGSGIHMPLPLKRFPVTQVDLVTRGGSEVDSSQYQLDAERGLLWFTSDSVRSGQVLGKIAVTYTGGYDLPDDAPAALSAAVIELIREQRRRASLSVAAGGAVASGEVRATQHGDTRVEYSTTSSTSSSSSTTAGPIPDSVRFLIEPFRAPLV
jgi:hypothetical protein